MPDPSGPDRHFDVGLLDPLGQGSRAAELTGDSAWLQAMVDAELALTRALVAAGLAPEWMGAVCDDLADAGRLDLAAIAAEGQGGGNPVIPLVKHLAAAAETLRTGASDHLHVGATSQDILDTAAMLVAHRVTGEVSARLGDYAATLAGLAGAHRGTAMAGRTLGQQASPTSFGFVVAGWLDAALTAIETIDRLRARLPVQFGGAVGNLAVLHQIATLRGGGDPAHTVDLVLRRFAAGLGLAAPAIAWHTNRLPVVDLVAGLAAATGAVGAFALDVTVLARTEIAEVGEHLGQGQGGSSAMPHKRNPVTAVLITAAARQAPGLVATLFGSLLAEDQRPSGAWHAEWQALRGLERLTVSAVAAAAALSGRLDVDPERMLANLEITDGLVCSERVTTLLAEALGKTAAFAFVQRASAESFRTHRPLRVVLTGLLSADGHDEQLRAGVWAAFDLDPGQGGRGIDRVLDRFRRATVDVNSDGLGTAAAPSSTDAVRTPAP